MSARSTTAGGHHDPPRAPPLQRDRPALGRQRAELGDEVAAVALHHRAQLRRAGDAAGGGERLGDLVGREVRQRPLVDPLGVGAHGEDEHHVGEVDGLPPRRRAHLGEGDVDDDEVAVLDQQVGRLDVAVGEPGVPQPAHEREALVDDLVVDLGVADLDGAVEELGDEQVLALGRQLDDAERGGRRDAGVAHHPQRVVLVLDEPAHASGTAPRPRAARTGSCGRSCTSGRRGRGSSRRASRTRTCRDRRRGAGAAASSRRSRRGRPGWTSTTVTPSWSSTAWRSASPRRPPTSRWAVLPPW